MTVSLSNCTLYCGRPSLAVVTSTLMRPSGELTSAAIAWVAARTGMAAILRAQLTREVLCMVFDITLRQQESSFWGFLRPAASRLPQK